MVIKSVQAIKEQNKVSDKLVRGAGGEHRGLQKSYTSMNHQYDDSIKKKIK